MTAPSRQRPPVEKPGAPAFEPLSGVLGRLAADPKTSPILRIALRISRTIDDIDDAAIDELARKNMEGS